MKEIGKCTDCGKSRPIWANIDGFKCKECYLLGNIKIKNDIETVKQHIEDNWETGGPEYQDYVMSVLFGDEEE